MEFRGHGAVSKLHKRFSLAGGLFGCIFLTQPVGFGKGWGKLPKSFKRDIAKKVFWVCFQQVLGCLGKGKTKSFSLPR